MNQSLELHRSQRKALLCFLLLAVICLCAPGLAAESQTDAASLFRLADDFWAWRVRYQPPDEWGPRTRTPWFTPQLCPRGLND